MTKYRNPVAEKTHKAQSAGAWSLAEHCSALVVEPAQPCGGSWSNDWDGYWCPSGVSVPVIKKRIRAPSARHGCSGSEKVCRTGRRRLS
jgi:hypothetical protein